jgi:MFS family permease
MANRFGTRRVFAGAIALFAAGSLLCGLARNIHLLVAFRPDRFHTDAAHMIHGIHHAFVVLGIATVISSVLFRILRRTDGSAVSQHRADVSSA